MSWEIVKLVDVCEIIAGQSPPSSTYNNIGNGLPFFQGKADFGMDYPKVRMWCSKPNKISKPQDILLSVRAPVGPTNLSKVESCIGRGLAAIRSTDKIYFKYIYYFFKSIEPVLSTKGSGSTFSAITINDVKNIGIPLPPLHIQKQIANILDKADSLRKKDQQLLQKYDELAQSIFIDMFGDPVKNEKGWKMANVRSLATSEKNSIKAGPFGSSLKKEFYVESGYKIYGQEQVIADDFTIGNYYINEERYQTLENCKIKAGDILISLVGTYGKISIVPQSFERGIINPRLMKITLNKKLMTPEFFKFLLTTSMVKSYISTFSRGGTMDIVNVGIMSSINVIIPPINIQEKFSNILNNILKQKNTLIENYSEQLFHCLIQKAFTGELIDDSLKEEKAEL